MGLYDRPVKLKPAYFSYIWGGTLLRNCLGKDIPADDTGESWEVSAHPRGQSVIDGGPANGMPLGQYAVGQDFYGDTPMERFPLLIKLLGAKAHLSVQVHPSDSNCRPGEAGKAEAWVVLACEPGAQIIYDIDCSREEFAQAVADGRMAEHLRRLEVHPGDVLDIPAGMVHALTAGVVVFEVQQNSDTTYRLYDWDRVDAATGKPRELHIDVALRVIEPKPGIGAVTGRAVNEAGGVRTVYIHNPQYTLERLDVHGELTDAWPRSFAAYTVIAGSGAVKRAGNKCFEVKLGDSFVNPAAAGALTLSGELTVLKSHVPPEHPLAALDHAVDGMLFC